MSQAVADLGFDKRGGPRQPCKGCNGSLGVEPHSRALVGVRGLKLKALCPFSYKRRPKS